MNKNKISSNHPFSRRQGWSLVLAAVIGVSGLVGSATANAQATSGDVFGKAPVGYTVAAHSMKSGTQREVHVDAKGHYTIRSLPAGVYMVTLKENGKALLEHPNVPVLVGRGIKVDLECAPNQCAEVADKQ
ncbi:carboxypeptidase-like regulatory domain-containing protein [Rhodanobacter sp. Col0626]|uniref:carboxypeptidase-like regulatory domain-containing protein n=1 Tax=Rhodanobacter sp. Col0626 TaxID=3415679 RepID=UPI003CF15153